jgi:hypothetical protein
MLTMPFIPLPGMALAIVGLVGGLLCFAFSVIYNIINSSTVLAQGTDKLAEIEQERSLLIAALKTPKLSDNEKKLLYLDICNLDSQTDYQKQMRVFQSLHLARTTLIEAMFPAVVFVSFVFLPLGIGLGTIGGFIGLAMFSYLMINAIFCPQKQEDCVFDEKRYQEFLQKTELNQPATIQFFFSQVEKDDTTRLPPAHPDCSGMQG